MRISLPEQIWIDVEPASYGSRALAYMIDFLIRWTCFILVVLTLIPLLGLVLGTTVWLLDIKNISSSHLNAFAAMLILLFFLVEWSYPIYFEVMKDGVTPGKRRMGLRVVDERGLPISFRASFLRTALITVDMLPALGLTAFVSMLLNPRSQRIGDLVARTMVVYDPNLSGEKEHYRSEASSDEEILIPLGLYNVMERFVRRRAEFERDHRNNTLRAILEAIHRHLPDLELPIESDLPQKEHWLLSFFERARPLKTSEAQSKEDRSIDWRGLQQEFDGIEAKFNRLQNRRERMAIEELRDIAESYQVLCQRLAYLGTFYPKTAEALRAARLVRLGRRLIYGRRLRSIGEKKDPFLTRVRTSFAEVRAHCAVAAFIGIVSGILTALLVQLTPGLSWHFLSEEVVAELSAGRIWTEKIRGIESIAASAIMTNNISVSITAFALGVTGGVGTVLVLIFNGAHLGGIFSALTLYGMAFPLLDFVVAHGFIELSIIVVAAGCGLYLGDALLHPGSRSRKRALQEHAAKVFDLIMFNVLCLVLAGVVEGYISPQPAIPFSLKLSLGLILGCGYWYYLFKAPGK